MAAGLARFGPAAIERRKSSRGIRRAMPPCDRHRKTRRTAVRFDLDVDLAFIRVTGPSIGAEKRCIELHRTTRIAFPMRA
ncbi:hypothetical protein [Burkholderia sp. ABCPW 14]|uniref:hypothetical protein n=1 Tax=Burkholderia sp. ABCPW 14 TaxID=1637860 RepID=UPI000A99D11F|nr:hypothetical protein [Burkholderia sp. ABCPW 14]